MKKIIILASVCAVGAANAATVCGTPFDDSPRIFITGVTGDLSLPSFYRVSCITGYDSDGLPNDLPNYNRICVNYTTALLDEYDYTYDLQDCRVDYDASQCDSKHYYWDRDIGCRPCSTGARANDSDAYHKNGSCNYCEKEYKYVGANNCQRCPGDQVGCMGCTSYHQTDWCMCDTGFWLDESTGECNGCPCGGELTASWPTTDPGECMLPAGGVCSDDSGVYTVTDDCYGYQM